MRVITQVQKITKNFDLAEREADNKILHFAAAQKTSNWARSGNYEVSRKFNKNWAEYLDKNENINKKTSNLMHNEVMQKQQKWLRGAIVNKEKKIDRKLGKKSDSDSDSDDQIKNKMVDQDEDELEEKEVELTQKNKELFLSKIKEKEEKEEMTKPLKKKKKKRQLSCSSGSERMVNSDDEGEAVMIQMKKGLL